MKIESGKCVASGKTIKDIMPGQVFKFNAGVYVRSELYYGNTDLTCYCVELGSGKLFLYKVSSAVEEVYPDAVLYLNK
jgi:hypothetical protein